MRARAGELMNYKKALEHDGLLDIAEYWLKHHSPPQDWIGDKWSWAFTEMPLPQTKYQYYNHIHGVTLSDFRRILRELFS